VNRIRVALAGAAVAGSMLVGGVIGAALNGFSTVGANAATPTPSASTAPGAPGSFKSNEDATHEAGESAAQETAENNGTAHHGGGPGGPGAGGSNESAAHEAGESAAREAAEGTGAAPAAPSATPSPAQ
jgi:hypothetical protein